MSSYEYNEDGTSPSLLKPGKNVTVYAAFLEQKIPRGNLSITSTKYGTIDAR